MSGMKNLRDLQAQNQTLLSEREVHVKRIAELVAADIESDKLIVLQARELGMTQDALDAARAEGRKETRDELAAALAAFVDGSEIPDEDQSFAAGVGRQLVACGRAGEAAGRRAERRDVVANLRAYERGMHDLGVVVGRIERGKHEGQADG